MQPRSFPVPSLIQGISQQSTFSRPQASAEDQKNCLNDLLDGARARYGSRVLGSWDWDTEDAFVHQIERSETENYIVVIKGSNLKVLNLADGTDCTVTGDISAYLPHTGKTSQAFCAATVEDTTFIGNRQKIVQMDSATSPAREHWGLVHFRSASYFTTYTIHVNIGGSVYTAGYTTPDNSIAANAEYIATNRLAIAFAEALNAVLPAGFGAYRRASSILISGNAPFSIYTEDALGGKQMVAFTDRAKTLADLPEVAWNGYQVTIGSTKSAESSDYHLKYVGDEQDGVWEEVVAPDTKTSLAASTMPHILKNTGLNTFTVGPAPWGDRLAGDGVSTAKDPPFVGQTIKDIQFIDSRLAILTEGSFSLSRARNAYVFFPDTVQTDLATAPILYNVANGKVTLLTRGVVVSKRLQLWANKMQSSVSGGQDPLREDTAESPPLTSYEYDGKVPPQPLGRSGLVFCSGVGRWNRVLEVIYREGTPIGEIGLTDHCPRLIPGEVGMMSVGGTANMLLVLSETIPNRLYVYQWFNVGEDRVQSAWNYWEMSQADGISWAGMTGSTVYLLVRHGDITALEAIETNAGGDEAGQVPLRADHRLYETELTTSHSAEDGLMEITLPWAYDDDSLVVFERLDDEETGEQRGRQLPWSRVNSTTITFPTDNPDIRFWLGARVPAERVFGKLYISDKEGTVTTDRIQVDNVRVFHKDTTSYSVVITPVQGAVRKEDFTARRLGNPEVINNRVYVEAQGQSSLVKVGLTTDEFQVSLLNDTIYPSAWEAFEYIYTATKRYA